MGRVSGSPNQSTKHWHVAILHPIENNSLWEKEYCTIDEIHQDFKEIFSKSQIVSYALKKRKCAKLLVIDRLVNS